MDKRLKHGIIISLTAIISTVLLWIPAGMQKIEENFDGPYYLVVAKSWYQKSIIENNFSFPLPTEYYAAHFPLYPLLINIFSMTGINHLQAMLLVNLLATIIGANVLYLIAAEKKWGNPLLLALAWLFIWPRMWAVRSIGSPETMFITFIMLSLYTFENKKYWQAAVWGILATLTKSPGILLLPAFGFWWFCHSRETKKWDVKPWPVVCILLGLFGVFWLSGRQAGDFWAYFHSGDNIHLQNLPFRVFDSTQPWVGNWWLEDIIWIYFVSLVGVIRAMKKSDVWGWWGVVFLTVIAFVSHRDIARYSLPLVPVVLLGFAEMWERKEVRWAALAMLVPLYFYSLNFVLHNTVTISNWAPFL